MIRVGTVDFPLMIGRAKRDKNNQVVRDFKYLPQTFKKGFTNKQLLILFSRTTCGFHYC